MEKRNYIKLKKEREDVCNLCGQIKHLTWDHVPPKAAGNINEVNVNTLFTGLPTEDKYQKRYQSGIKFRTICDKCNNDILGNYDMAYKNFIAKIVQLMNSNIILPEQLKISVEINKVCKAICGHILAAKQEYDDTIPENFLRDYVNNPSTKMNSTMKLYYWIYPYNTICLARDIVVGSLKNKAYPKNIVSVMSSFPLAVLLDSDSDEQCGLEDLFQYTTNNIDDIVEIPLNFKSAYYPDSNILRHFLWPCNVSEEPYGSDFLLASKELIEDSRVGIVKKR